MNDHGNVLIVDDEPQVIRALRPALTENGYMVDTAEDGRTALDRLARDGCDLVLLDLGLPDLDGKSVISKIREWSQVPIVVISARDVEHEKIAALDLGADDYVNKPFAIGELLARMRAALRGRDRRFAARSEFRAMGLEINFADRLVQLDGAPVRLTPREYELLTLLARHAGRVVTHRHIMASIRGADAPVDAQFVRVLVGQLRGKIETTPAQPERLLTEPGIGYRLVAED